MAEPRFEKRDAFWVLGLEEPAWKMESEDPGFNDLWTNRFMAQHDVIQPQSTDKAYYAVWLGTNGVDLSEGTHLAGMAVCEDAVAPEGWVIREIPAAEYAIFPSTLRDVGDATDYALHVWLPSSEHEWDRSKPRFDWMPPDTNSQDSPTDVWIPVRPRARGTQ